MSFSLPVRITTILLEKKVQIALTLILGDINFLKLLFQLYLVLLTKIRKWSAQLTHQELTLTE